MKRKLLLPILIFLGVLTIGIARAQALHCPSDSQINGTYCNSASGMSWCLAGPTCAVENTAASPGNPSNGTYSFSCTVNNWTLGCNANYLVCAGTSCVYNDPALHCASLMNSNCTAGQCATCVGGYNLCTSAHTCTANNCASYQTWNSTTCTCVGAVPTLQLSYDSASAAPAGSVVQQSAAPALSIPSSGYVGVGTNTPSTLFTVATSTVNFFNVNSVGGVGIGTSNPGASLEIIPSTGYAMLAGNYKIGNVALPTAPSDVATMGWVNSALASATSSITTLWGGVIGSNIWNLNTGKVGIGISNPTSLLQVSGSGAVALFGTSTLVDQYLTIRSGGSGAGYWGLSSALNGGNGGYVLQAGLNKSLNFFVNNDSFASGSPAMMINTSGSVGIGTTSPQNTLAVNGDVDLGARLRFDNPGAYGGSSAVIGLSGATGKRFLFYDYNSGPIMAINDLTSGGGVLIGSGYISSSVTPNAAPTNGLAIQGSVGIATTSPAASLEVVSSVGSYTILSGSKKIGNTALPTVASDVATKGYIDTSLASFSTIGAFVGVTASTYDGANSAAGTGYTVANNLCNTAFSGSHVCAAYEMLHTIAASGTMPTDSVVWIFNGPPGYTAPANDCDGRTSTSGSSYGAVWQTNPANWPQGRGMITTCNNTNKLACCK